MTTVLLKHLGPHTKLTDIGRRALTCNMEVGKTLDMSPAHDECLFDGLDI